LLCLEGLSIAQTGTLFGSLGLFNGRFKQNQLRKLMHAPITSFQGVWAEILWGRRWSELGIAGYGRPDGSLNKVVAWQEDDLPDECKLLNNGAANVVANLPLLTPQENRYWLSDGSLPLATVISPACLSNIDGVSNYQPKPFFCTALAASNLTESIAQCFQVESRRLQSCGEILAGVDWDTAIIRLTVFDLLSHLMGAQYLAEPELIMQQELKAFLSELNNWLEVILQKFPDCQVCIMSSLGHNNCVARVSLNQILWQGGFCEPSPHKASMNATLSRRMIASRMLDNRKSREPFVQEMPPALAVTPSWDFDLSSTVCASVVQGGIFLNLQQKYETGIVSATEAPVVLKAVREHIAYALEKELGITAEIWQTDQIGSLGPDLMIYAEGVDFHNNSIGPAVDTINKPRSTHNTEGFCWLPPQMSLDSQVLTPLELHAQLLGVTHG
jgi:hypothetical protein